MIEVEYIDQLLDDIDESFDSVTKLQMIRTILSRVIDEVRMNIETDEEENTIKKLNEIYKTLNTIIEESGK